MAHATTTEPPPSSVRFDLIVRLGEKVDVVPLHEDRPLGIGRSSQNGLQVDDPAVSRQHLQFYRKGDLIEVEDLGSANGSLLVRGSLSTLIEGEERELRLAPHHRITMGIGDSVRIGSTVLGLQLKTGLNHTRLKPGRSLTGPRVLVDPGMQQCYELVGRAARSDIPVLILGETGAGKEVMAETVHRQSRRSSQRFLLLNCAALTETLLESELFGHEKGAFTGAHSSKAGLLEATDGGTVFLDEIGELPMGTQAKLLRVLEERSVLRVGATKPRPINVRFVTATNRDLQQQIRLQRFRNDLYYRISGLVIRIPALRQRPSEIEPLARHFLRAFCETLNQREPFLSGEALAVLQGYPWPGNVRELKNVLERAALIAEHGVIRPEHILLDPPIPTDDESPMSVDFDGPTQVNQRIVLPAAASSNQAPPSSENDQRQRVIDALEACGGNQTRAAQMLGVSRRTLINRLERWNLPRPKKR
jgi:two-component system response regulator AtoC